MPELTLFLQIIMAINYCQLCKLISSFVISLFMHKFYFNKAIHSELTHKLSKNEVRCFIARDAEIPEVQDCCKSEELLQVLL